MARNAGKPGSGAPAGGPYSPSVRVGDIVAVAGQCGYLADRTLPSGITAQTRQALDNVRDALAGSGCTLDDVLTVNVYLTDKANFADMNAVYAGYFTEPYPARTTTYVGLGPGVLVEINVLAVRDGAE
ncbi:MAG TPA: RidA family protein [Trebonia sp.]|jgi:2-iminobutanoate/2-iminopropanoate deaminase